MSQTKTDRRVIAIARAVRRKYEKANPTIAKTLDCKCAIVSAELSVRLLKAGIEHVIRCAEYDNAWSHVFITVGRNLLDLTATQFGESEPIIYRPYHGRNETQWFWKSTKQFQTAKQLIDFQHKTGWPKSQIHTTLGKD
jgi:hypothetical protein